MTMEGNTSPVNKMSLNFNCIYLASSVNNFQGDRRPALTLKALATIPYFNFRFFPHLLIFLQFRDPSNVLNLSTKAVLQKCHNKYKRAKYLQFEIIFRRA